MKKKLPLILSILVVLALILTTRARASERRKKDKRPGEVEGFRLPYLNPALLTFGRLVTPADCLWSAPVSAPVVALTYDDGPSAAYLRPLLDALRRYKVKVTFFVLGDRLFDSTSEEGRERQEALRQAVRDGHEIAFHGYTHRSLYGVPDEEIRGEIQKLRAATAKVVGAKTADNVRFFRAPFGHLNGRLAEVLKSEGLRPVNASILPGDAYWPKGWLETPHRVANRVLREVHPGAIIALHVGETIGQDDAVFNAHWATAVAEELIPKLRAKKYRFARLGDLVP